MKKFLVIELVRETRENPNKSGDYIDFRDLEKEIEIEADFCDLIEGRLVFYKGSLKDFCEKGYSEMIAGFDSGMWKKFEIKK